MPPHKFHVCISVSKSSGTARTEQNEWHGSLKIVCLCAFVQRLLVGLGINALKCLTMSDATSNSNCLLCEVSCRIWNLGERNSKTVFFHGQSWSGSGKFGPGA